MYKGAERNLIETMDYSPCISTRILTPAKKVMPSEALPREEQNDEKFSSLALSSEELQARKEI